MSTVGSNDAAGAKPATDAVVIDAMLSSWVYRIDSRDQGLSVAEIQEGMSLVDKERLADLSNQGFLIGDDGFVYDTDNGFAAAIVEIGGAYKVVFRGTDTGWTDIRQDVTIGLSTSYHSSDQAHSALNLVKFVLDKLAEGDKWKVSTVGHSLGGGLAGLATAYFGIESNVFDPAPFRGQIEFLAVEKILKNQGVSIADFSSFYGVLNSLSDTQYDEYLDMKNSMYGNISSFLSAYRIKGELLSADSTAGWWVGLAASHFDVNFASYGNSYDLGVKESDISSSVSLHSVALLALEARSRLKSSEHGPLSTLLKEDGLLRQVLAGDLQNVVAPFDHGREISPAPGDAIAPASSADILFRALLKTVETDHGLYDYFYNVFGDLSAKGAASVGRTSAMYLPGELGVGATLHAGVSLLALSVLRDAVANTSTVSDIFASAGVKFAGGSISGNNTMTAPDGALVIDRTLAKPIYSPTTGGNLQYGVKEVDLAVFDAVTAALEERSASFSANQLARGILGVSREMMSDGTASLSPWEILAVQAGSDNGLTYSPEQENASRSHVIFGGMGADKITGSAGNDFVLGGKGTDTIVGGNGNDVIVGGEGRDLVEYHGAAGVTLTLGISSNSKKEFDAGVFRFDKGVGGSQFGRASAGGSDILVSIEKVELGQGDDTFSIQGAMPRKAATGDVTEINGGDQATTTVGDTLDLSGVTGGSKGGVDFLSGSVKGIPLTFRGFETLKLSSGDDTVGNATGFSLIDAGAGNDTVANISSGTRVRLGAGRDTFMLSSNVHIEDATSEDQLIALGRVQTGATRWCDSEAAWVTLPLRPNPV